MTTVTPTTALLHAAHIESPPSDNRGDRRTGTAIGDQCQPKGGGQGECRELFSCLSVARNIRRATPNICSFMGHAPIVCCPKATGEREGGEEGKKEKNMEREEKNREKKGERD